MSFFSPHFLSLICLALEAVVQMLLKTHLVYQSHGLDTGDCNHLNVPHRTLTQVCAQSDSEYAECLNVNITFGRLKFLSLQSLDSPPGK